jgi:hypothetical protein
MVVINSFKCNKPLCGLFKALKPIYLRIFIWGLIRERGQQNGGLYK